MKNIMCLFFCLFFAMNSYSQALLDDMDLSTFSADALSLDEVAQIQAEMDQKALTINELQPIAISRGMSPVEFDILAARLNSLSGKIQTESPSESLPKANPIEHGMTEKTGNDGWIFGSEIFANSALSFEPNQTLSNPSAYVLGVDDELEIAIHGIQQFSQLARVNGQGDVVLANIGSVHVSGLQLGAATDVIRRKADRIYSTLNDGRSELSITITEFKSIQVTMIGVKQPGNYTLSSLSTVFNALHVSGGPSDNGSYRKIELIRNNKLYKVIDLYKFLTEGDLSENLALQQDDIIRVPVYEKRVTIQGSVKRTGIFELIDEEGFEELFSYCSGFSDNAYKSSLQIKTTTDSEMKINTVSKEDFGSIVLKSGDIVNVGHLLGTYENRVKISGAVFRPEDYELVDGMRISDLIMMADGLKPDAFVERALLLRKGDRLIPEVIGVNISDVLNNQGSESNLVLNKDDELIVSSILSIKEKSYVEVQGEIRKPGTFRYIENMTLYDLIIMAGGFNEFASRKIEIARVVVSDEEDTLGVESEVIEFEIDPNYQTTAQDIALKPFDYVSIYRVQNFTLSQEVYVSGEVEYPGVYIISSDNERIGDIMDRSGGLNSKGNIKGVKILRNSDPSKTDQKNRVKVVIPVNYKKIKKNPDCDANIVVRKGDHIYVERLINTASVFGSVEFATEVPIKKGRGTRYYVNTAGGFKDDADKKRTYVQYANGKAKATKNFLGIKFYPKAEAGCIVAVPEKSTKEKEMSTQEVVGLSSVLSSITGITIAIITLVK